MSLWHVPPALSVYVWACECVFVCVCMPLWLCISVCAFMPLKSCYHTQQSHCSTPIHPPWHNSLWLLAHMTLPHCSPPLPLAWPDSPLKSKGLLSRPLWPFYCPLLAGQWIHCQDWLNPGSLGQNLARQIVVKREDFLPFPPSLRLLLRIYCQTQAYKGRQSEASRMSVQQTGIEGYEWKLLYVRPKMLYMAVNGQQSFTAQFSETAWFLIFSTEWVTFANISNIFTPMGCFCVSKLIYKPHGVTVHVKEAVWGKICIFALTCSAIYSSRFRCFDVSCQVLQI